MRSPGLIRWNFVGYLALFAGIAGLYLVFGLSGHVKDRIAARLTALNGAPVTIENLTLQFSGPTVLLSGIAFHSPDQPQRNRLEVGKLQLELEWTPLLRNRYVVRNARASDVHIPPLLPIAEDVLTRSLVRPADSHSLAFASDFLADPKRKELPDDAAWNQVPSIQARAGIRTEITTQIAAWRKQVDGLSQDGAQAEEALKNEKESAAQLRVILDQLARSKGELSRLEAQVKADGNLLLSKIETLNEIVPHDVTVMRQSITLPSLEFKQIAAEIGTRFTRPVITLADDFTLRLLPWLEAREFILTRSMLREQGTDFAFTGRNLPPRLWLKNLELTSVPRADGSTGGVIGRVQDLSSEPSLYPASLTVQADFPKAEIAGARVEAQIDHRNGAVNDSLVVTVTAFPVRDLDFVSTPGFRLGIVQATANLNLELLGQGDTSSINVRSTLEKVNFRVETASEAVKQIFDSALSPLTSLQMESSAQGPVKDLRWAYSSNLSDQLRTELQRVLSQEYAEYFARVKEQADGRIAEAKKVLLEMVVSESEALQSRMAEEQSRIARLVSIATEKQKSPGNRNP